MKSPEEMARIVFDRREEHKHNKERKEEHRRKICSRLSAIALVLTIVGTIGVGYAVAATLNIGDLFKSIFTLRINASLSENQATYIEEHVATIGESVTQNGYTVTVKGALTDGTTAHILVDIVAPVGRNIEKESHGFYLDFEKLRLEGQDHISSVSDSFIHLEDNDGKDNTVSMLIEYNVYEFKGSNFSLADGKKRNLQLRNLWFVEDEYPYSFHIVTEGLWEYEFAFAAVNDKEIELLTAPLSKSYAQISGKQVDATITSLLMKGLSATVYYNLSPDAIQEAGDFGALKFVMKDGSIIHAYPRKAGQISEIENGNLIPNSACHYCTYVYEAPVDYEDLEKVFIGDTEIVIISQ